MSHDQALFQIYAINIGYSERSVLPKSTIYISILLVVGSLAKYISFRAIVVLFALVKPIYISVYLSFYPIYTYILLPLSLSINTLVSPSYSRRYT